MNGKLFDKKFFFEKILDETAYYVDYKVWHNNWRQYVKVRTIKDTFDHRSLLEKEAQTWIELGLHPNIITALFSKEIDHKMCLFLEYGQGRSLNTIPIEYSSEKFPEILEIAIQISQAMMHLHEERIPHGELLPENIIFDHNNRLKIDNIRWHFGKNVESIAKGVRPLFLQNPVLFEKEKIYKKFSFLPPEYFTNNSFSWDDNFTADVYSFGVLLYYLCCRALPFYIEGDIKKIFSFYSRKHEKEEISPLRQKHTYISNEFSELVSKCLSKNIKNRPSFDQIKSELCSIYETYTGLHYITESFQDTHLLSISLNNRALGELDSDNKEKAINILQDVAFLHTERISATLNLKLLKLRTNEITVREVLESTNHLKYIDLKKVLLFQGYTCLEYGSFISDLLEEIKKYPDNDRELKILEACLHYRMRNYEEAQKIFRTQVKNESTTQELLYMLGASYREIDMLEDNYKAWKEGLNYPLPYLDLLIAYGMTLTAKGDWSKARKYFEKGFQSDALPSYSPKSMWSHVRSFHTDNNSSTIETIISKNQDYISVRTISGVEHIWNWPSGERQQKINQNLKLPLSRTGRIHQNFLGKNMSEIVFGPDKTIGISIHGDKIIKVWDLKASKCLHELKEHSHAVTSLAITRNGKTFVSGSLDKSIKIWDTDKGVCKATLLGHEDCINCVDISSEGDIVISGSWDKTVRVWDVLNEKCIAIIDNHKGDITALSLSADGSLAVSGDSCGNLRILDVPKNKQIAFLQGEKKSITGVALSQDKSLIVASFVNGAIRVFEDVAYRDAPCWLRSPFILDKLDEPISLEKRQKIAFWQNKAENFSLNNKIEKALNANKKILEISTGNIYLNAMRDISKLIKKYKLSPLEVVNYKLLSIFYHERALKDFLIIDEECFFSISENSQLCRWQVSEKSCDIFWEKDKYKISSLIMSKSRKILCFGDEKNYIHVWRPEEDEWETLEGHTGAITSMKIINNDKFLLSSSADGTIQFWDYQNNTSMGTCHSEEYITDMVLTDDESVILTSSLSGQISFWETTTKERILKSQKVAGAITCLAIPHFDKSIVITCGLDGCLKLWSMRSGSCSNIFQVAQNEALTSISISQERKIALIGGSKGNLYVWDFEKEKNVLEINAHTNKIVKVSLSADGLIGYSAGIDGILKLWAFEWTF